MNINVLVTGGICDSQSGYSALQFCKAALSAGHSIKQIFFYQNGVTQATQLSVPMSDEFDVVSEWLKLMEKHDDSLVVCVSASERRGILGTSQAKEFEKAVANLHPAFEVAGLGALHEAILSSDRMVMFK